MRVLLTGVAGFLGSHLADRLLGQGYEVIGVDDLSTGREANIAHLNKDPCFFFRKGDVTSPLLVDGGLDWIFHFASPASPPKYLNRPLETLRVNGEGTRHLLDLALKKGAGFFLASTSEVYGDPQVHPQTEVYWGNVNPIGVRSVYDEGKRFAEALTSAYQRRHGLATRIIRIFNTYGPRMDPDDGRVVSSFICRALRDAPLVVYGDGEQTRSFQYVDDLTKAILKLMNAEYFQPVNLGNPEEFTVLELARFVLRLTGSSSNIIFEKIPEDDPRRRKPDITLAKSLLSWQPTIPLTEGLQKTIAYFRAVL